MMILLMIQQRKYKNKTEQVKRCYEGEREMEKRSHDHGIYL